MNRPVVHLYPHSSVINQQEMQKYDESFDRYVPQPYRSGQKSEHEMVDRDSQQFVNKTKNLFESMDFEEIESVMWRKVRITLKMWMLFLHL